MQFFRDMIKARAAAQPFKPNMAARLYAAIGGTAANQAVAITLGYEAQRKPFCVHNPAGAKLQRAFTYGTATLRHGKGAMPHRPFRHGKLGAF